MARLTPTERREIYGRAHNGEPQKEIAKRFGVTIHTVSAIKTGRVSLGDDYEQKGERCSGCGQMIYRWPCLECLNMNHQSHTCAGAAQTRIEVISKRG